MSDSGNPQGGANGGNGSGQGGDGNSNNNSGESFALTKAEWDAAQEKIKALENDNFKYRERLRQSGSSSESGATNTGTASATTSGDVAAVTQKLRQTNFRYTVAEQARKAGCTAPELLHRLLDVNEYGDEEGKLKDAEATINDLKTLYPQLFKAEKEAPARPGNVDAGAGGNRENVGNKSFSDQIRDELKAKAGVTSES